MSKHLSVLPLAALALAVPAAANAQTYDDLPPLAPLSDSEVRQLPPEYRTAPVMSEVTETVIVSDGVETITRTRRIDAPHPMPAAPRGPHHAYAPAMTYAPAPVVFERDQWIEECRRRTAGRSKDDAGTIIGGLLGAIAGGVAGYEIAGAGDRVLGTVLGVGGGGLVGGLLGSLFDGDKKKNLYNCEAALDSYLSQYGAPAPRIASREIAYPAYAAPAYSYGYGYPAAYSYAPPPQMVMVPVRSEVQQQVVVRETVREETYTVPGAVREIPARRPSPKMIKSDR
jgi:Predicted outer membrane lipoprotein